MLSVYVYRRKDGTWVVDAPEWRFITKGEGAMWRAMAEAKKRTEADHLPASQIVLGRTKEA